MPTSSDIYNQIVSGTRSLNTEISSIQPSTPIYLYELDLKEIYPQISNFTQTGQPLSSGVLRIYNDYNLFNLTDNNYRYGTVSWQGNLYYPFPIMAEGFNLNSAGTLATPIITVANTAPDTSNNSFYKYIRMQVQSLGDIVGSKFTRIKSFLKYLHGSNFSGGYNPYTNDPSISEIELPRDIYYVERKVTENKYKIEYSLASILDVENLTLPSRTVLANKCPFQYRGEGCLYEYNSRKTLIHSGIYGQVTNPGIRIHLPLEAPPVATDNDELFLNTILSGTADSARFSGIAYNLVGVGNYGNTNQWSFTNYTLNAGTAAQCATALNDNSTASVAITQLAAQSIVQLGLSGNAEVTRVRLTANNTITNDYQIQFSPHGGTWMTVRDVSGFDLTWNLNGQAAGTYNITFPSRGMHTGWRLISTNTTAGTQISELNFSGQYRVGDQGLWNTGLAYQRGDFTFLEKNGIKYYYVSLTGHTGTVFNSPPNRNFWGSDSCSKTAYACRLRWLKNPYFRPVFWPMTRGGWNAETFNMRYKITGAVYNFQYLQGLSPAYAFSFSAGMSSGTSFRNVGGAYSLFTKTAAGGAWDQQVYTTLGLAAANQGYAEAVPQHATNRFMFGINKDPTLDPNYTSIDFAWYCNNGTLEIWRSGTQYVSNAGTYDTNTTLRIMIDTDGLAKFYRNGTLYTSYPGGVGVNYAFDSSFFDQNASALFYFGIPNLTGYALDFRNALIPSWYNLDSGLWPRRPDCHDPSSYYAHGLPKDYTGEYLNGFLPYGGFPGVDKTK